MEKKQIEEWVTILNKADRKMMTRKEKEAVVTQQLNKYMKTELQKVSVYTENDVHNKIDSIKVSNSITSTRKRERWGKSKVRDS